VKPARLPNSGNYSCPQCKEEIYKDYVEKKWIPKASLGLVGFTGHGKTCYLTSLFYLLRVLIARAKIWDDFSWLSLDSYTDELVYKKTEVFEQSILPEASPSNFPKPALIRFHNIPFMGDYFLSFYDTAGAVFESVDRIREIGRFVAFSEVVLFIISLYDIDYDNTEALRLLNIYIRGVHGALNIDLKRSQHLIVVLSKGDVLELPEDIMNFLQDGSYRWYRNEDGSMRKGLKEIKNKSIAIKKWLRHEMGPGLINLLELNFKSIEFAVVSSTGAAPVGDRLATKLNPEHPKRVLDPFLLAIDKLRPLSIWEKLFWW
jgi:hypothetical protein